MDIFSIFRRKKDHANQELIPVQNVNPNPTPIQNNEITSIINSIEGLARSIREMENRISELSNKFAEINTKVESNQNEINNIKNNLEKMFSIYELLMRSYNPFVETEEKVVEAKQDIQNISITNNEEKTHILPLKDLDDNPAVASIIIGWLSYLVKKSNMEEVEKALDYYENIKWITEKVKIKLKEYLTGLSGLETEDKKLTPKDHLVSLYIITKLSNLSNERNLERMKDLYKELVEKGYISPTEKENA
ncbi:MAG: FlaD/FlaE family flagellar protein [Nanopusillaceae archaeon]